MRAVLTVSTLLLRPGLPTRKFLAGLPNENRLGLSGAEPVAASHMNGSLYDFATGIVAWLGSSGSRNGFRALRHSLC